MVGSQQLGDVLRYYYHTHAFIFTFPPVGIRWTMLGGRIGIAAILYAVLVNTDSKQLSMMMMMMMIGRVNIIPDKADSTSN